MDPETARLVDLVDAWSRAVCTARSALPEDLAAALGLTLPEARRPGWQLMCPPPPGVAAVSLVLRPDAGDVTSVGIWPAEPLPLAGFTERFGQSEAVPGGPHATVPTIVFPDMAPADLPRACAILARPVRGWPDQRLIDSVTLYLIRRPTVVPGS